MMNRKINIKNINKTLIIKGTNELWFAVYGLRFKFWVALVLIFYFLFSYLVIVIFVFFHN